MNPNRSRRRRTARLAAPLALGLLAAGLPAFAQQPPQQPAAPPVATEPDPRSTLRTFAIDRATSPIKVDAVLDEPAWADATVVDIMYEWFPGDNIPPPVATDCLVTFDDDNLYVGFRAQDPRPQEIRAHLMDRDSLTSFLQDDYVGFNIDPFNDERRGFQFRLNPLGVQVDGVQNDITSTTDMTWDSIWDSAGRITEDGWVAEAAIPFQQLRFPRTGGPQTWGWVCFRSYPRNVVHRMSSKYTDRSKNCFLCEENKVSGFEGMSPGRNLEVTPTVTTIRTDAQPRPLQSELVQGDEEVEPGLSARWGVTPNLVFNGTLNPDFSQVEADSAQLDVNNRFALFFPEKRPFFLEGADFFSTPLQAVFTRSVADPNWGAKLTGKEGKNAVGLFVAEDDRNELIFPSNEQSLLFRQPQEEVTSGVLRYRRDVGKRSVVGVLATGREATDYHNAVLGLDGQINFTTSDTLRFQWLRSDTEYPDPVAAAFRQPLGSFDGDGLQVRFDHKHRSWRGAAAYTELDPGFRADYGFITRVDVKTAEAVLERLHYGKRGGRFTQISYGLRGLRTEDHDGVLTDDTFELFGQYQGPLQSQLDVAISDGRERFGGQTFDVQRGDVVLAMNPSGKVRIVVGARFGDEIDITKVVLGDLVELTPGVQVRLGRSLSVTLNYQDRRLSTDEGRLFRAAIAQSRAVYQFNVRTAVRAILQYTDVDRDQELYLPIRLNDEERFFSQLLFSYKLNAQTVLFLGYTDNRLGNQAIDLEQTERVFFFKVGYAFLF